MPPHDDKAGARRKARAKPVNPSVPLRIIRGRVELIVELERAKKSVDIASMGAFDDAKQQAPAKRIELPVPLVSEVPTYAEENSPTFKAPLAYIRHNPEKHLDPQHSTTATYDCDLEDERWWKAHQKVSLDVFEKMIDLIEKESAKVGHLLLVNEAEALMAAKLNIDKNTHPKVVADVHAYWKQKRNRLKKPLLRYYWIPTPETDTSPHLCFRPRVQERYRLRRHRRDDMESYLRLAQLKTELEQARNMLSVVRARERLRAELLSIADDRFQIQVHDLTDDSGGHKTSDTLKRRQQFLRSVSDTLPPDVRLEAWTPAPEVPRAGQLIVSEKPRRPVETGPAAGVHISVPARDRGDGMFGAVSTSVSLSLFPSGEQDVAYQDGLALGVALGLNLGVEHGALGGDGDAQWGARVSEQDIGGTSVVVGVGARGAAWERRYGLVPGVGSGAGQSRSGSLQVDPQARPPPMISYPPSPTHLPSWLDSGSDSEPDSDTGSSASLLGDSHARKRRRVPSFVCRPRVTRGGRIVIDRVPVDQRSAWQVAKSWSSLERVAKAATTEDFLSTFDAAQAPRGNVFTKCTKVDKFGASYRAPVDPALRHKHRAAESESKGMPKLPDSIANASDSEDDELVAMSFAGLTGYCDPVAP